MKCLVHADILYYKLLVYNNNNFFFYCSENGFEDSLSTLGLVSGLFSAVWSAGYVLAKLGFLTFKINHLLFFKAVMLFILWKDVLRAHYWWNYHTETEF